MRASEDFVLREIAGEHILIPIGAAAERLYGLVSLNETGLFLWQLLREEQTESTLLHALTDAYEVEPQTAAAELRSFLAELRRVGLLTEPD